MCAYIYPHTRALIEHSSVLQDSSFFNIIFQIINININMRLTLKSFECWLDSTLIALFGNNTIANNL